MDLSKARWSKSKFSAREDCVEVAYVEDGVAVRHSRGRHGPVLLFTQEEWKAFIAGVNAGEFDIPD